MKLFLVVAKNYFMIKVAFFQKNQLGIGVWQGKPGGNGSKLDFRAFM